MFTFVLAGVAQLVIVDTGLTVMVEAAAVCVAVRVKDVIVEVTVLQLDTVLVFVTRGTANKDEQYADAALCCLATEHLFFDDEQ